MGIEVRNKEISWLSFNERLLQEASKRNVPVIERIKFLGIYSNNLDEFFRVRVAILRRLAMMGRTTMVEGADPREVLDEIERIVVDQGKRFEQIYKGILKELAKDYIYLVNEQEMSESQGKFVRDYFLRVVRPRIMPIILKKSLPLPMLSDDAIYMAVELTGKDKTTYALIEVPSDVLPRFVIIPSEVPRGTYIILLEDIIRYELKDLFYMFEFDEIGSYIVKLTRDAELDINDDVAESYVKTVEKSLEKRGQSEPTRFVYDKKLPRDFLRILLKKLNFTKDDTIIGGGRIHNFKDFMNFPKVGPKELQYQPISPVRHKRVLPGKTYLESISEKDLLFHFPYQSFIHFIDLLREASIDPKVTEIKLTVYRVAPDSSVMNALINAARNGKQVTVVLELRARFNEQDNIEWGNLLDKENVKVIFGVPGLKVHSKICIINRKEHGGDKLFACVGTGNFHEDTARVFSDHLLCTADPRITREVNYVFDFFERNYKLNRFRHLMVSPFNMRSRIIRMINQEIRNKLEGKEAKFYFKCNNLVDPVIIRKIHDAARAGVEVRLNVRGMFSLLPTPPDQKYTIPCIGLIDRFLEHSRVYYFHNNGHERLFISSSDLMSRNLDRRVEVGAPIYDEDLRAEIKKMLELQWQDNEAARVLDNDLANQLRRTDKETPFKSQMEFYRFIRQQHGDYEEGI
ncbi:polyphosphate kinase 1 [Prolixibacter sp. SD074]|jgi:polyphosphate kinase|uniref:polyphosphate kinase 1 n=1 Tax=Prolixibacter sp. SD074 TaxID=2652391 RepID=UPI001285C20C|nr:polyphosphate kinase 1 [Prolixibacter sp. SD074]GET30233.1 polyphosphate kinase [Prolixibacter sp. SD074]